jgi:adenylosuccinate lyase
MLKENSIEIIRLEDKKLNNPLIFNYYIYLFLGKFVMNLSTLTAISPIDGRYHPKTLNLTNFFSEYALIRYRLIVEIRWLQSLCENSEITEAFPLTEQENDFLEKIIDNFDETEAKHVKSFEAQTNHDVKAVEYYLQDKLKQHSVLNKLQTFLHFACTSEDINNIAYALMMNDAIHQIIQPSIAEIVAGITLLGKKYSDHAMLARTHGQPATPTTMGKELINFSARLKRPIQQLAEVLISAKCNGAVGNYNAHIVAYPSIDWRNHCQQFVTKLGLAFNAYTTQIEPHDGIAEVSHVLIRINNILLDYCKDIWHYISLNYFTQKTISGEVGSSTMPHKVNPIDFENAEGNLGLANSLFEHFANKLSQSRLQRDLSDSTVLRNLGSAFAYTLIAYHSIAKGNNKLQINQDQLHADLQDHWHVIAEPIQMVMRKFGDVKAYEKLRDFTRGKEINKKQLHDFIQTLNLPAEVKATLLNLMPETYIGLASQLVKAFS